MNRLLAPVAAGLAALTILLGACSDRAVAPQPATAAAENAGAASTRNATPPATSISKPTEMSTADLVKLAEPAIVRIDTSGGVGSGFVVSEDGYIITNAHVVQGRTGRAQTTVGVTLSDGARVDGTVKGFDSRSDIALIKIEGVEKFKALTFAKLDDVLVGQDVIAIGYALDLKGGEGAAFSVTRGIISAKNRAISESSNQLGAIQTDAAINHGNSGGPLLNMNGEVVGVNTAIAPDPTTGAVAPGIGFAMGSDMVKAVYEDLLAGGKVTRGYLGVRSFEALRPAKARDLGIPADTGGVYLAGADSVNPGDPGANAGMKSGDVITKIGGVTVRTESDLATAMIREEPGKQVAVEIYRAGKKQTVTVTLGTPPQ